MTAQDDKTKTQAVSTPVSVAKAGKEHEPLKMGGDGIKEIGSEEVNLSKEVKEQGVEETRSEVVDIPPDVKKLGVSQTGPNTPLPKAPEMPKVELPISDTQVINGLHANFTDAIFGLAIWCIRKLEKAHFALKVIHGKITRVKADVK